jgi:hypothetical protein
MQNEGPNAREQQRVGDGEGALARPRSFPSPRIFSLDERKRESISGDAVGAREPSPSPHAPAYVPSPALPDDRSALTPGRPAPLTHQQGEERRSYLPANMGQRSPGWLLFRSRARAQVTV